MSTVPNKIERIVVLMMENRSFDHLLGGLKSENPSIDGLSGNESNPDTNNQLVKVLPLAEYQGQFAPHPATRFADVLKQMSSASVPTMQGFVQSYFDQRRDAQQSRKVMYYFSPEKLPVLTTLASSFAVFNAWFSSVPGAGRCNHDFAHFGSSFGRVSAKTKVTESPYISIFDRLINSGRTAKLYYYDAKSPPKGSTQLFLNGPAAQATHDQFFDDCRSGTLPAYSFIEPNHSDHLGPDGTVHLASDQHPDHNVQAGEVFLASVYNAIRQNPALWSTTALLIVYDEHGGFYDHVPPPPCDWDRLFQASGDETGTGQSFRFDRLGVRVPAVLVSPWIAKGTVVAGGPNGGIFEHASIPATVAELFLGPHAPRSPREMQAATFLNIFGDVLRADSDSPVFQVGDAPAGAGAQSNVVDVDLEPFATSRVQELAGYQSDEPEGRDLLGVTREVEALATVLAAKEVSPPLSLGLFGDWGTGKSFFMRQLDRRIRILQEDAKAAQGESAFCENIVQIMFNAWNYIDTNLWASLTSEIFEGLAAALAQSRGTDSRDQRARVLAAASSSQGVLAEAERKNTAAVEALRSNEQRLEALRNNKALIEASLDPTEILNSAYRFAVAQPQVQQYIKDAGTALHIQKVDAAAENLKSEILELHGIWRTIVFTIRNTEKLWIWMAAPVAATVAGWAVIKLLAHYNFTGVMEEITAAVVSAASFLAWFIPPARNALRYVQKARAAKEELIEQKRAESIQRLEAERAQIVQKVDQAQRDVERAAKAAAENSEQLEQLRADRRLADYIRQRNESTDYTKNLGLIARVRSDFKQLSTLLRDVQEEADSELKRRQKETEQGEKLFPRIDRIILYIDDLDRCPEKNVVEVLQAVNLLLAFPLFVVVVGVDPRWLLHSLEQHSVAFTARSDPDNREFDPAWQSTPLNYLEKIFQIPYTLRPMDSRGFGRLVDTLSREKNSGGLPQPSGTPTAAGSEATSALPKASSPAPENEAQDTTTPDEPAVINRKPEHLRIEAWEQSFMKLLYELIPSPRAGKRFINIYRLIRASVSDRERAAFVGDASGGEYQCALLLLAILTGHPNEATDMLRELIEHEHQESWWTFVATLKKEKLSSGAKRRAAKVMTEQPLTEPQHWLELFSRLDRLQANVKDESCTTFAKWAPQIARFSFQSGRVLLALR